MDKKLELIEKYEPLVKAFVPATFSKQVLKDNFEISGDKSEKLKKLKNSIFNIQNCELKKTLLKLYLQMATLKEKLC